MTARIDFRELGFDAVTVPPASQRDWEALANARADGQDLIWRTPEQIDVAPLYSAADLEQVEHLHYQPGLAPFVRGPYSTM
ncbi:MAG TPA: methylmalonyl-CoA mutase family protein, partial [Polyangiales bacterium]|nr:methylmalonyl-CoA mutase family protein [Polyangiales bacterium]